MATIANSTIKLSLDSSAVERGVSAITKRFDGMGNSLKAGMLAAGKAVAVSMALVAAAAGAALVYFKGFVGRMGEVADMATRLGITTDEVQRIGLVSKQSGTSVEAVAKAMEKFSVNLVKASEGGESASIGLARLGISSEEFLRLSMDQKLLKLSEAYSKSNRGARELAGLQAILGKSGAELIPLLSMGPEKMSEALGRAAPVSERIVYEMEALGDHMDGLKQQFEYIFSVVFGNMAIAMSAGLGKMVGHFEQIKNIARTIGEDIGMILAQGIAGNMDPILQALDVIFAKAGEILTGYIYEAQLKGTGALLEKGLSLPETIQESLPGGKVIMPFAGAYGALGRSVSKQGMGDYDSSDFYETFGKGVFASDEKLDRLNATLERLRAEAQRRGESEPLRGFAY